jgi:hypothetical protein
MLGLFIAIPVSFVASAVYTVLALEAFARWPTFGKICVWVSRAVTALLLIEVVLLLAVGPKSAYAHLHHVFTTLHLVVLVLCPPAVANLVLSVSAKAELRKWLRYIAGVGCCWVSCVVVLIGHIMIDESIVGIDAGRPFYMTSNQPPNQPTEPTSVSASRRHSRLI